MFRVPPPQLPSDLGIRHVPEAPQIACCLNRAPVGREQQDEQRLTPRADARRFRQAEELLELDREHHRSVFSIFQRMRASAWRGKTFGSIGVDPLPQMPVETILQRDVVQRTPPRCSADSDPAKIEVAPREPKT